MVFEFPATRHYDDHLFCSLFPDSQLPAYKKIHAFCSLQHLHFDHFNLLYFDDHIRQSHIFIKSKGSMA